MFQLIYDGSVIFSGNTAGGILIAIVLIALIILAISAIWKMIRRTARLKYEFITIIAHKFRTPLTYIKWSSDSLLESETDPYKKQSLSNIKRGNESLIELTSTLMELTDTDSKSRSSYAFERVDLCDFVRASSESYKGIFHEKNIFFSVSCADEKVMVRIDKARMEFVLQVLLENACTYTPTGRTVEVGVGRKGHKAVVTVTDHGIGVAERDQKRLFTKFFRADNAKRVDTEGFGVGLYLAQSIMRRHGGKIEAFSDGIDAGSTFRITLKRVR